MSLLSKKSFYNGFTLIELMIALVVLAILAAIAAPSFTTMISNNRMLSETQSVMSSINLARSEAIKRATFISICPSGNGSSCSTVKDGEDRYDLNQGLLVFVDDDANPGSIDDSKKITAGGDIIKYHKKPETGAVTIKTKIKFFRFDPQGYFVSGIGT